MWERETIQALRKWLKPKGIEFFRDTKEKYGEYAAVYMDGNFPHCVHFREGMQVRNWMRTRKEFEGKDAHWYDNNWESLIKEAVENS